MPKIRDLSWLAGRQSGRLRTICEQTVRILLDVAAHVRGNHAGQAHNSGRLCMSWDGLVGFQIPASRTLRAAILDWLRASPDRPRNTEPR
jgi:hypothetical protein